MTLEASVFHVSCQIIGIKLSKFVPLVQMVKSITQAKKYVSLVLVMLLSKEMENVRVVLKILILTQPLESVLNVKQDHIMSHRMVLAWKFLLTNQFALLVLLSTQQPNNANAHPINLTTTMSNA